jgi:nicotinamidase-related amidase
MTRALIVIDVQESFRQRDTWRAMSHPDIAGSVNRLVDAFRGSGEMVVWVLHSEPGTGTVFDPALGYVRLLAELAPLETEPVIVKTSVNAFTSTDLEQRLISAGVTEVVICGIRTEQCCETTARVASDLGFAVVFVTDATSTSPVPGPDAPPDQTVEQLLADPATLGTEAIIERTERILAAREFASIATTAEIVASTAALIR